jgi:hypothetical protein
MSPPCPDRWSADEDTVRVNELLEEFEEFLEGWGSMALGMDFTLAFVDINEGRRSP